MAEIQATVDLMSDETQIVGRADSFHDSIQSALKAAGKGGHVRVLPTYIPDKETFPINVTEKVGISGVGLPTVATEADAPVFRIEVDNERPPGVDISNLEVEGGTNGFLIQDSKYVRFENCHVDSTSGAGWRWTEDERSTNSATLVRCTAHRTGGHGYQTSHRTHSLTLRDCRAIDCRGIGAFVNGPSSVSITGGSYEKCDEAGVKLRRAESATIRDAYIENNAQDHTDVDAEVAVCECANPTIRDCYFNGMDNVKTAVRVYQGTSIPSVSGCSFRGYEETVVSR